MSGSSVRRKIFVLSDWHLGGVPDTDATIGTQICRSANQLAAFINWVGEQAAAFPGTTEIVINGDMVDFLAPDGDEPAVEWISDQEKAVRRLNRIVAKARGPFDGLCKFLEQERTEVTVALGNHDAELSLPRVRQRLAEILGNNQRFRMVYDGEAIVRGRVLIEHGNRYDAWNILNHNGLREERSHLSRGLPIMEAERSNRFFRPPAGTLLVVYAFNTLLTEAPFLNLLKPETQAALPLLIALEPNMKGVLDNIIRMAPVIPRRFGTLMQSAAVPADRNNLSGDRLADIDSLEKALQPLLGADTGLFVNARVSPLSMPEGGGMTPLVWVKARVAQIAKAIRRHLDLSALVREAKHEVRGRMLEIAFKRLQHGDSFRPEKELPEYIEAAGELLRTGKFDLVVFGHTHLQKKVTIPRPGQSDGCYINTGTWADIMKLPPEVMAGGPAARQALGEFFDRVAARDISRYLFTSLGYAEIELAGDAIAQHDLRSFTPANPRSAPYTLFA